MHNYILIDVLFLRIPCYWIDSVVLYRAFTFHSNGSIQHLHSIYSSNLFLYLFTCIILHFSRGVILYAMVCGSLPFGDDTQVAKMQLKPLTYSRPITQGNHYICVRISPVCTSFMHKALNHPCVNYLVHPLFFSAYRVQRFADLRYAHHRCRDEM